MEKFKVNGKRYYTSKVFWRLEDYQIEALEKHNYRVYHLVEKNGDTFVTDYSNKDYSGSIVTNYDIQLLSGCLRDYRSIEDEATHNESELERCEIIEIINIAIMNNLGWVQNVFHDYSFKKKINGYWCLISVVGNIVGNKVKIEVDSWVETSKITSKQDIDNVVIAYNRLQDELKLIMAEIKGE